MDLNAVKTLLTSAEWNLINNLTQDLFCVKSGIATEEFALAVLKRIDESCDSSEAVEK